ncbi:MAG: secondary thiamine-phosphate synthase enzyme YjbQ [Candidatus Omnitrophica bacterium]|nr:secondary thiamine-phosphate synthase enzyme YjbQ [Candidatus Omnitrophota bacterium]
MVITKYISVRTAGNTDIIDITRECQKIVDSAKQKNGVITIFNPGSTGGLTTIEFEPNLTKDFKEAMENIAPIDKAYHHHNTWHDDNGSSHVRSSVIGTSLSVPFVGGKLTLGTWQQIIFCDFDTSPRERELVVQVIGE